MQQNNTFSMNTTSPISTGENPLKTGPSTYDILILVTLLNVLLIIAVIILIIYLWNKYQN